MTPAASTADRILRLGLAVGLAGAWLLASALPAAAVDDWSVTSPPPGATVSGEEITIEARVTANAVETVEVVELRLRRDGGQVGPVRVLDHRQGPRSGGDSAWATGLRPLASWAADGQAMPNGRYRLEVRATSTINGNRRETTDWRGHEVRFDVPAPPATVTARAHEEVSRSVEVAWQARHVPDFRRYVVERAPDNGGFSEVATVGAQSADRFLDVPPDDGTWRYRIVTVRAGADGQDLATRSAEASTGVETPEPPDPDPEDPNEPPDPGGDEPSDDERPGTGEPTESPTPTPGAEGSDEGSAGEDGGERPQRNRVPVPSMRGTARSPSVRTAPPQRTAARPQADRPQTATADPGYDEHLPYEQQTVVEREIVRVGGEARSGGLLTVGTRELVVEQVAIPIAGGLLLFVVAGHILRLARPS